MLKGLDGWAMDWRMMPGLPLRTTTDDAFVKRRLCRTARPPSDIAWSKPVQVSYSTHAIDGLSENDFICAAKLDALFEL